MRITCASAFAASDGASGAGVAWLVSAAAGLGAAGFEAALCANATAGPARVVPRLAKPTRFRNSRRSGEVGSGNSAMRASLGRARSVAGEEAARLARGRAGAGTNPVGRRARLHLFAHGPVKRK